MARLEQEVKSNIARYAGTVLVNRALCDVRDMLKPSARMLMFSQIETSKNLFNKPYIKCARIVGDALGHWYTHGESSCYHIYTRLAKPFAMRYPLEDFHGNYGTLVTTGNEAAMRYPEIRLSELGQSLFNKIKNDTIWEWEDNFDETEIYPRVSPSLGFYNIVNGSTGIGYGAASSVPQFNLKEVNKALITLLWNPDADFEDIYCAPDFATGGILLNEAEVKESLRNGIGRSCNLRSVIEYNPSTYTFRVTELPYSVYSGTICEQIEKLVNENPECGIEGINDMSARTANIEIYISKKANADKILKMLYKETSLQYFFGINLTMLEGGRKPRIFTWKEALQAHLDHEKVVYLRSFEFEKKKILERIHIIEGLLKAIDAIDDVVKTIKGSTSTTAASTALQKLLGIDETQAKAILDIKLSRLAKLEINKYIEEKKELEAEVKRIEAILNDEVLLKKEIEKGLESTANKFGDARRTKIMNLSSNNEEVIEKKQLQISYTNKDNIIAIESSTLYTQRRGGVGNKLKLDNDEYVTTSIVTDNTGDLLFFTEAGDVFNCKASSIELNQKTYVSNYIPLGEYDKVCALTQSNKSQKYIIFITKDGMLKKSEFNEYNIKRGSLKAINLNKDDKIVTVIPCDEEDIGIATKNGNFLITKTDDVRATGRVTAGVHGIKLNEGDEVIAAHLIPRDTKEIISISQNGLFKKTAYNEFTLQGKNTKGSKIQKFNGNDLLADFIPISQKVDLIIGSTLSTIKLTSDDVPLSSKSTVGIKSIKLSEVGRVLKILICN